MVEQQQQPAFIQPILQHVESGIAPIAQATVDGQTSYVPPLDQAIYVQQQSLEQPTYVQPPVEQLLVRKQSFIHQQPLDVNFAQQQQHPLIETALTDKPDLQLGQAEIPPTQTIATLTVTDGQQLHNPVLQAVASDQNLNRSATPEPACSQLCCSDVYTTDSCGESSAAESVDAVAAAAAATNATASEKRLARRVTNKRRRTVERGPRLSVLSVQGSVVEYQLETMKQKTVTFKFDQTDTVPADVANNLIRHSLLSEQHADIFIEQVILLIGFFL